MLTAETGTKQYTRASEKSHELGGVPLLPAISKSDMLSHGDALRDMLRHATSRCDMPPLLNVSRDMPRCMSQDWPQHAELLPVGFAACRRLAATWNTDCCPLSCRDIPHYTTKCRGMSQHTACSCVINSKGDLTPALLWNEKNNQYHPRETYITGRCIMNYKAMGVKYMGA